MSKFFIWISSSKSSNIIILFFSQIMGMYFMSMVVLMRMNMPVNYTLNQGCGTGFNDFVDPVSESGSRI
jgi:hypothetical protein